MLTVLGGLAEFERELSRAHRRKARGVKLGRKPKLTPHQKRDRPQLRCERLDDLARA
jgi:DNA invertase Pin-like site-specific DNA recombinase